MKQVGGQGYLRSMALDPTVWDGWVLSGWGCLHCDTIVKHVLLCLLSAEPGGTRELSTRMKQVGGGGC